MRLAGLSPDSRWVVAQRGQNQGDGPKRVITDEAEMEAYAAQLAKVR